LVISIAGLTPAALGPYGSAWAHTPQFNRLAAEGLVFDQCWADSSDDQEVLISLLTGTHAGQASRRRTVGRTPWWSRDAGRSAVVVTESATEVFDDFGEIEVLPPLEPPNQAAELEETQAASWVATGLRALTESRPPDLLWLHSTSLLTTWDAPQEYRAALADDENFEHWPSAEPPRLTHRLEDPPDALLRCIHAYAAQIRLLDDCLGPLLAAAADRLVIVVGTSGMAMGEHGWIGPGGGPLLSPRLHLPLLMRPPQKFPLRCARLIQPPDVAPALADWLDGRVSPSVRNDDRGERPSWGRSVWRFLDPEEWAAADSPLDQAFATDGEGSTWLCSRWLHAQAHGRDQLFLHPDDRFCANDVWTRVNQLQEPLQAAHTGFSAALSADDRGRIAPVAEELLDSA
jgi:arylsulfatase A-like enzyme